MRTEIDLDAAAAAGLIDEDQAIALRNFQAKQDTITTASSEKFQLFGGYADLVLAMGTAMILIAVAIFIGKLTDSLLLLPIIAVANAVTCVIIFALTKRIKLRAAPALALVLTLAFAGFSLFGLLLILKSFMIVWPQQWWWPFSLAVTLPAFVAHVKLMHIHWRAFRFPPTIALAIAIYAFPILMELGRTVGRENQGLVAGIALAIATGTMIAGIWWDLTDIRRETERSQVAFWLHCVAGMLMSRALFWIFTGTEMEAGQLIPTGLMLTDIPYVLLMVVVAAIISLLLDRRSLLVGCLLPTAGIFDQLGNGSFAIAMGLIVAGTSLIFFSVTWEKLRKRLLATIPTKIAAQLPRTNLILAGQRPTRRHQELWRRR